MENNPFKVFTKLITERIRLTIEEQLPESQFGFRRGRSTLTAVELLLKKHLGIPRKDYTVFIDFTKAFDLLDTHTHTHTHTYIYLFIYLFIYLHIHMCACVFGCVCLHS